MDELKKGDKVLFDDEKARFVKCEDAEDEQFATGEVISVHQDGSVEISTLCHGVIVQVIAQKPKKRRKKRG